MNTIDIGALSDPLRSQADALKKALSVEYMITWTSEDDDEQGEAYREARQPDAVGRVLICSVHRHLKNYRVGYLYRERMERNGRTVLGKAFKVGAKLKHFAELDFLIEINWSAYALLTPRQRVALIDHELSHCGTEIGEDGEEKLIMHSHDIEEFGAIVQRWGLWLPDVAAFAKVATQIDLWSEPAPKLSDDGAQEILAAAERGA